MRARTYSKGNRQKVALVAALASDVELLLLDEPTAGLDPLMDAVFREHVRGLRDEGRTVLLSSHLLSEVEALCDRVSIIRDGRVVETGSMTELRHLTRTQVTADVAPVPAGVESLPGLHHVVIDGNRIAAAVEPDGLTGLTAALTAAFLIGVGASLSIGLLTAVGLAGSGLPAVGSAAFGMGWAAAGLVFAAVAAVTAQVRTSARAATGLGLMVVGVTYLARAIGDMADPDPGVLSWLSPIGWNSQVRPYAGDRWLVLALALLGDVGAGPGRVPAAGAPGPGRRAVPGPRRAGAGPALGAQAWQAAEMHWRRLPARRDAGATG